MVSIGELVNPSIRPAHTPLKKVKTVPLLGLSPLLLSSPKSADTNSLSELKKPAVQELLKRPASQGGGPARGGGPHRKPQRRDKKLEKFLERQATAPWQMRRAASLAQRESVKSTAAEYDVQFWGAHGADGFRKKLISQYGSTATAWRVALDPHDSGKLSFNELCTVAREIGFGGNLKKVWKELDSDDDGFISLVDLDVEAHKAISKFNSWLLAKYGSTLQGWRQGFDVAGTHRLEEKEFVERCAVLGYDDDAKRLFRLLRMDQNNKCITLKEIDPQAHLALKSGDPCAESFSEGGRSTPTRSPEPRCFSRQGHYQKTETVPENAMMVPSDSPENVSPPLSPCSSGSPDGKRTNFSRPRPHELGLNGEDGPRPSPGARSLAGSQSEGSIMTTSSNNRRLLGVSTPTRTSNWIRELSNFQRGVQADTKRKNDDADMSIKTVAGLRTMMLTRYGTMLAAWRQLLDPQEKGKISFSELCEAMRFIGYSGNLKAAWVELDPDLTGYFTLKELDPKVDAIIKDYKELVRQKHGNLVNGWVQEMDKDGVGRCTEATFVDHCKNIGCTADARELFHMLQTDPKCKFLNIRDWDIRASRALFRGDTGMLTEELHADPTALSSPKACPTTLSFNERQESSFHHKWVSFNSSMDLLDLSTSHKEHREADVGADDLKTFKMNLKRKYGTLASAWRLGLDPEGLSQLPFNEFASVLRIQGYSGNVRRLWRDLDPDNVGYITMANFDPEADALLGSFRAQLVQRYGDIITAWQVGIDPNKVGRLEEADFCSRCKRLGLDINVKQLYNTLVERGRTFIMLKDIEPKAVDAWYRGDHKAVTVSKPHGDKHVLAALKTGSGAVQLPPAEPNRTSVDSQSRSPTASPTSAPILNEGQSPSNAGQSPSNGHLNLSTRLSDWSQELGTRQRRESTRLDREERDKWMGVTSLQGFRALLVERYGSSVSAWRSLLDADGNGRLSFNEFCKGCRCLSYHGNVKELWVGFKGDVVGYVTLEAIDPEADAALKALRQFLLSKYECILDAWHQWLDDEANLWLDEAELSYKLNSAGHDVGGQKQWHQLFLWLLPDITSRHVHVEDMQAVLIGVSNTKRRLLWMGEKKPPPKVGRHGEAAVDRPLEVLRVVLARKFGSVYTGWWRGIDVARSGSVPMADFTKACMAVGYPGNMKALYRILKKDTQDFVTLRDIDPEVATTLETFASLVTGACGSFLEAWHTKLDPNDVGYVEELVFNKFCADIQYPGSAKAVWKMFNPIPGRFYLFFEDFGQLALAPSAKSPSRKREPEAWWRKDLVKKKDAPTLPTQATASTKDSVSIPTIENMPVTEATTVRAPKDGVSQQRTVKFEEPAKPGVDPLAKQPAVVDGSSTVFSTETMVASEAAVAAEEVGE